MKVTVSFHQRQMLRLLGARGGRVPYRFGITDEDTFGAESPFDRESKIATKQGADTSIRAMAALDCAVIKIEEIVGALDGRKHELVLTDAGRAILEELLKADKAAGKEL